MSRAGFVLGLLVVVQGAVGQSPKENSGRCPGLNYDAPLGLFDAPAIQTCDQSRLPADTVTHPFQPWFQVGFGQILQ